MANFNAEQQIPSACTSEWYKVNKRASKRNESKRFSKCERGGREAVRVLQEVFRVQEVVILLSIFPRCDFGEKKIRCYRLEHLVRVDEF